ncbi:hypothetical protein [Halolamina litorea]|uniref:PH domain-containing protein n=1 Tax=Halolamina litorea TaxID=1515593 RepID=A0ABD6BUI3_9EURY
MSEEGTIDVGTVTRVWSVGWQWPWVVTLAVMLGGNFLFAADRTVLGIGVLVAGLGIAVAGVRAVNRHSGDAFDDGTRSVRRAVAGELGLDDTSTIHSLAVGSDSVVGFDCPKSYDLAVVTLGESALTVHHDGSMDLLNRSWTVGDQTERIPYKDVRSVTEEDGTLRMELVDGGTKSLPAGSRPDDLLAALGRRLDGTDSAS